MNATKSETHCECGRSFDDLTNGLGEKRNYICHGCGAHRWDGRIWTKAEWEVYVNDVKLSD